MLGNDAVVAAHIRPQGLGDQHGAIGLKVVLQEGDQHPGRGHTGVVQGMAQLHPAVFVLVADFQPPGLGVAQIGAGANLEILLLPGDQASMSQDLHFRSARSPEQHSNCRTGISRDRNSSTL